MARAGILYSQVAAAASKLAGEGKNPTVDTVRAALGATGSKSTITPMLKRWKEEHAGTVAEAASGLPAAIVQAVREVYDGLRADATAALERALLVHRDEIKGAQAESAQLRAQVATLTGERTALATELGHAQGEAARLRGELHTHSVQLTSARVENTGLAERLADRAAEVATVNQQLTHARTQFEHYQEANAAQRKEERQSFERRITQLESEIGGLRRDREFSQAAAAQHAGHMARVIEENEKLEHDARSGQQELGRLRAERDRAASEASDAAASFTLISTKQDAQQRELADARTALAVQARETTMACERLEVAESRSEALAAEKIDLLQRLASVEAELRLAAKVGRTS